MKTMRAYQFVATIAATCLALLDDDGPTGAYFRRTRLFLGRRRGKVCPKVDEQ
jgi:hypothetical protein